MTRLVKNIKSALNPRNYLRNISLYGIILAQEYKEGVNSGVFKSLKAQFGGGLPSRETFGSLVLDIVQIVLVISGSVAVIFLIVGGFRYITASGNEEQTEGAKKTMTGAIIGLVIIALSFAIIAIITNILSGGDVGTGVPVPTPPAGK